MIPIYIVLLYYIIKPSHFEGFSATNCKDWNTLMEQSNIEILNCDYSKVIYITFFWLTESLLEYVLVHEP